MAEREKEKVCKSTKERSLDTDAVRLGERHAEVLEEPHAFTSFQTTAEVEKKVFAKGHEYSRFGVLVVGKTGTGKSCLINNIFAEDVATEGHSLKSETKRITKYRGEVRGSEVFVYDTPGLEDTEKKDDGEYLKRMEKLIADSQIDLTVCCISMEATRFDRSLTRTFIEFNKIGLKWESTIFVLTFADRFFEPPKLKVSREEYFRKKVEEWRNEIQGHLKEYVGLPPKVAHRIAVYPSTYDYDVKLPSNEDWFSPLWLAILKALPINGVLVFMRMHQESFAHALHSPQLEGIQEELDRELQEHEVQQQLGQQPQIQQPQDQQEAENQPYQRPNINVDEQTLWKIIKEKFGAAGKQVWTWIRYIFHR